jgi:hypothetical protein
MSAGWAWKCDSDWHDKIEIVPSSDVLGRVSNQIPPVGWSHGWRIEGRTRAAGELNQHYFVFCDACSDGKNL